MAYCRERRPLPRVLWPLQLSAPMMLGVNVIVYAVGDGANPYYVSLSGTGS